MDPRQLAWQVNATGRLEREIPILRRPLPARPAGESDGKSLVRAIFCMPDEPAGVGRRIDRVSTILPIYFTCQSSWQGSDVTQ